MGFSACVLDPLGMQNTCTLDQNSIVQQQVVRFSGTMVLGKHQVDATSYADAYIDEVTIWCTSLSEQQVLLAISLSGMSILYSRLADPKKEAY